MSPSRDVQGCTNAAEDMDVRESPPCVRDARA